MAETLTFARFNGPGSESKTPHAELSQTARSRRGWRADCSFGQLLTAAAQTPGCSAAPFHSYRLTGGAKRAVEVG